MEKKVMDELMKVNENNRLLEATFFELQEHFKTLAKHTYFLYDQCLQNGFDEKQSLEIAIRMIGGGSK